MTDRAQNLPPTPRGLRTQPLATNIRPRSPSEKPALSRQRDHSACRRPDTPLRVRKTRENLNKDERLGDVPPPCVGCSSAEATPKPLLASAPYNGSQSPLSPSCPHVPSSLRSVSPEQFTTQPGSENLVTERPKSNHHRSVSKRMLSSLKSAAARTRSTHTIRPMESEASLLRRISGRRRKPTNDPQPERRAYSFDVSRDSVASEVDQREAQSDIHVDCNVQQLDQRSFTDSTVSTTALVQDPEEETPSFGTPIISRVGLKHRYSGAPESPPPRHPAGLQLTPRPFNTMMQLATEQVRHKLAIPYIRLDVVMDTPVVDYGEKRFIWVAVEATVETHVTDQSIEG
jgi:hypothetical protein